MIASADRVLHQTMALNMFFILCGQGFYLYVCLCTICMPSAHKGQKRLSNPLELEYQIAVTPMWVLGMETRSSRRAAGILNY